MEQSDQPAQEKVSMRGAQKLALKMIGQRFATTFFNSHFDLTTKNFSDDAETCRDIMRRWYLLTSLFAFAALLYSVIVVAEIYFEDALPVYGSLIIVVTVLLGACLYYYGLRTAINRQPGHATRLIAKEWRKWRKAAKKTGAVKRLAKLIRDGSKRDSEPFSQPLNSTFISLQKESAKKLLENSSNGTLIRGRILNDKKSVLEGLIAVLGFETGELRSYVLSYPRVSAIFISSEAGKPMQEIKEVEAQEGKGLSEDRYCLGQGSFSKEDPGRRQVTLISALFFKDSTFSYADSRRNIITEGIELMELIGKEFSIGENARFRGVKYCTPCWRPSGLVGNSHSFRDEFFDRGGLVAEVIKSGVIGINDMINFPPKEPQKSSGDGIAQ
jgi:hypothetical protein